MKTLRLFTLGSLLLASLPACDRRTAEQPQPLAAPQPDETEIERRVQQRLAEEHLTEDQRRAREREQELAKRETALEKRERELREQQDATAAAPAPAARHAEPAGSYQIFYDALTPHGAWMEVDPYGYVWQPREAAGDPRWRPYTDGRWSYTDCGWTWISSEPFGWATYHYGRWVRLRRLGWCWVPGDQWAPAWVSWRTGDRYIGWAPLPPEARFDGGSGIHEWADSRFEIGASDYAFVPASDLGEERVETAVVPPEQNVTIINQTTNVTNIVQNNNQLIINHGPDFQTAQARSRRPIAQLRVERTPEVRSGQNAAVVRGNTLQIAAPVIRKNSAQPARPAQAQPRVADTRAEGSQAAPAQNRPAAASPQASRAAAPAAAQPSAPPDATAARAGKLQEEEAEKRRALLEAQHARAAEQQKQQQLQQQQAEAQRARALDQQQKHQAAEAARQAAAAKANAKAEAPAPSAPPHHALPPAQPEPAATAAARPAEPPAQSPPTPARETSAPRPRNAFPQNAAPAGNSEAVQLQRLPQHDSPPPAQHHGEPAGAAAASPSPGLSLPGGR